jgi:hypothetical protein
VAHAGDVPRTDQPLLVTTAGRSPRDEQRERQRRYLFTMAVRLVCWILAIVLFGIGLRWAGGIAVGASLVLPWVAVVAANAGPRRTVERPSLYSRHRRKAIEPPPD